MLLSRLKLLGLGMSTFGDLELTGQDIWRDAFKVVARIGKDILAKDFSKPPSLSFSLDVG